MLLLSIRVVCDSEPRHQLAHVELSCQTKHVREKTRRQEQKQQEGWEKKEGKDEPAKTPMLPVKVKGSAMILLALSTVLMR